MSDLLDHSSHDWNWTKIQATIPYFEPIIHLIPVSSSRPRDRLVWLPVKNGRYNVISWYGLTSSETIPEVQ